MKRWSSEYSKLLQILLLPILLLLGYLVWRKAIELPEARGQRHGKFGYGGALSILFVGDSSACGVGVGRLEDSLSGCLLEQIGDKYCCSWSIVAKSAITTSVLIELTKSQAASQFQAAVISIGINDINSGKHVETWLSEISEFRSILVQKFRVEKLIFSGIPPVRHLRQVPNPLRYLLSLKANIFEQALQDFCKENSDCFFVDIDLPVNPQTIASDGFHPNQVFYAAWAARISELF